MAADRFPYDQPSRKAMVMLIQETRPGWNIQEHTVTFDAPYFSPTHNTPGRTFLEVTLLDRGIKAWFRYRRLDIGIALGERVRVNIEGNITSRKIVEAVNYKRDMRFDPQDVWMTDTVIAEAGSALLYRMRARPGSLVWYGYTIIEVVPESTPTDARLTETGEVRMTEDGEVRMMEVG